MTTRLESYFIVVEGTYLVSENKFEKNASGKGKKWRGRESRRGGIDRDGASINRVALKWRNNFLSKWFSIHGLRRKYVPTRILCDEMKWKRVNFCSFYVRLMCIWCVQMAFDVSLFIGQSRVRRSFANCNCFPRTDKLAKSETRRFRFYSHRTAKPVLHLSSSVEIEMRKQHSAEIKLCS